jgi:hypothetical protein
MLSLRMAVSYEAAGGLIARTGTSAALPQTTSSGQHVATLRATCMAPMSPLQALRRAQTAVFLHKLLAYPMHVAGLPISAGGIMCPATYGCRLGAGTGSTCMTGLEFRQVHQLRLTTINY